VVPFEGTHQAGIETPVPLITTFVAFDLRPSVDREAVARLLRLWTDDARRLTRGEPALADTEPELASGPAALTVTVGIGPGVLDIPGLRGRAGLRPDWLRPLPPFAVDALETRWSDGDLLLQVGGDDAMVVAHALRVLTKDADAFATVRWRQRGFQGGGGARTPAGTPRNLMGQVDGTVNPAPGTVDFAAVVWTHDGPDWVRGGTGLVVRRIRMILDTWDALDRASKEQVIGRRLATGAPLTGTDEHDPPDLTATDARGLPVIPPFAHIRRAAPARPEQRFLRRPHHYDDGHLADGTPDLGLLFVACAADLNRQFVPVQRRLAEQDLLNTWTTPVGSAVFAMLPGVPTPDRWLGQELLA
jgi:dye decolorizing peroxidase